VSGLVIPAIGQPWPDQGGIYAGVCRGREGQPDHHLILAEARSTYPAKLNWADAMNWAERLVVDGHKDFSAPTRYESAVLFGNVGDLFEPEWHWTSTQYSDNGAFYQGFNYGYQDYDDKKYEGRVRAVRRLPVNPSILASDPTPAASTRPHQSIDAARALLVRARLEAVRVAADCLEAQLAVLHSVDDAGASS